MTIKGIYRNGVIVPQEEIHAHDGQEVTITLVEEQMQSREMEKSDEESGSLDDLLTLIEECQIESGITDLAHQHDHYLYGTPKRDR